MEPQSDASRASAHTATDQPETVSLAQRAAQQFAGLVEVVETLRVQCPWDAKQTQLSLVKHLIEETAELVDAIEVGTIDDQREELGDLLLQVVFHASIAHAKDRYDIGEVISGIADKLISRHPYVYGDEELPQDFSAAWERRKKAAKKRESVLDGIAVALPTLARASKVAQRIHDLGLASTETPSCDKSLSEDELGEQILSLVRRAQLDGIDADQATRTALRRWEDQIRAAEQDPS